MDIVHPGYVYSKTDGDRHFIGFLKLCKLYGLNPRKAKDARNLLGYNFSSTDKHYYPRHDGKYT